MGVLCATLRTGYATSKWLASTSIIPSQKSAVSSANETNQSKFFWNTRAPNLTSWRIAFKRDLVVGVCQPHELSLTALVSWHRVAMRCPCRNTLEQFVESLNSTRVLDRLQSLFWDSAEFIWDSILRMREKMLWFALLLYCTNKKTPIRGFVVIRYTCHCLTVSTACAW